VADGDGVRVKEFVASLGGCGDPTAVDDRLDAIGRKRSTACSGQNSAGFAPPDHWAALLTGGVGEQHEVQQSGANQQDDGRHPDDRADPQGRTPVPVSAELIHMPTLGLHAADHRRLLDVPAGWPRARVRTLISPLE
jgi:hypothetical protein